MSRLLEYTITNFTDYSKSGKLFDCADLTLLILTISEIEGNTKLQKQVFLTWKEIFEDVSYEQPFYPYRYGAYSNVLNDVTKILNKQELIKIDKKGKRIIYRITEEGRSRITKKMKDMDVTFRNLHNKMTDWKNWDSKGIKRYVYRNYPEYTRETLVPYLKWE